MRSKLDTLKAANPALEIQLNLRNIAQFHKDIPMVVPTGVYDNQTQVAIKEFQKKNDLSQTGEVDYSTWKAIMEVHNDCLHCINKPRAVFCFPDSHREYKKGDSGNIIYILQIVLKNYHNKYKNYPDIQATGTFDFQTEEAVKQFQKRSNLPVTGVIDRRTWNYLNQINEICGLYE